MAVIIMCLGMALTANPGVAQEFPSRPVRVFVPLGAGSAFDVFARAMGEQFQAHTGQPFVVEDRPGGNQVIAANALKNSDPDGYTISLFTQSGITLNPLLYDNLSYDPYKDFDPVAIVALTDQVFAVTALPGVNNFADLVNYSKANPDKLNAATLGPGSDGDLILQWLKQETGGNWTNVPYRGAPDIVAALKSGQVQMTLLTYGSLKPYIDAGTLKPIFTRGSEKRSALLPDVPSYAEAGLPALDALSWAGMFAPHGTPAAVVAKLNREITTTIADPQFQARFMYQPGLLPPSIRYQDIAQFLAKDHEAWAKVVSATGTKLK